MNGPLLVIDASTYRGTTAVVSDGRVVAESEAEMRGVNVERLMPAVADVLRHAGVPPARLGGVVCGEGPGSFTSLRIAASIAKGVAVAANVPLHAVSSLALIVAGAARPLTSGRYLALLNAMRGEWFAARIDISERDTTLLDAPPIVIDATEVARIIQREQRTAIGPGQTLDVSPRAAGAARLVGSPLIALVDRVTWEPSYGRLAEAQVRWEKAQGRPLGV